MMKLSKEKRQEEILKLLWKGERLKTSNLAIKYGKTDRAIQLDLKKLREMSPIIKREKGVYFIPDEYLLLDARYLHPLAIDIMLAMIEKTLPDYIDIVQDSLVVENDEINKEIFLFDFEIEEIKNEELFVNIKRAISQNVSVKFFYKNREHLKNIFPLKIGNFNSYWYLMGYDLKACFIKTFYINDIIDLSLNEESYLDNNKIKELLNLKIDSSWYSENKKSLKLKLINEAKDYIKRRVPKNIKILKEYEKKGELIVEFSYFNEIEAFNFIKKWLPNINILDENLKNKFKELLLNSLKKI